MMTPPKGCSFPAAHSMDSAWFAVDEDGEVAFFDTGEAGAVPKDAYVGEDYYALLNALAEKVPRADVTVFHLKGRGSPAGSAQPQHIQPYRPGETVSVLMFLTSLEPVASLLSSGNAQKHAAPVGHAITVSQLDHATLQALHDGGHCVACYWHFGQEEEEEGGVPDASRLGLYRYEHLTDNVVAGPYGLVASPQAPLKAEQLPSEIREKAVKFSGRFRETDFLQPVDVWPSDAWSASYVGLDMVNVKPLPGREKDYRREYEESRAMQDGMVWTPPSDAGPVSDGAKPRPWWKFW